MHVRGASVAGGGGMEGCDVPGGGVAEFRLGDGLTEDVILDVGTEDLAG